MSPASILEFAARAAEQAKPNLGPSLDTLFAEDGVQHGVRLPASLLQQSESGALCFIRKAMFLNYNLMSLGTPAAPFL